MPSLDRSITRLLGVDLRLLYGVGVPILMICGVIAALCLAPTWWLLAGVMALELLMTGVVLIGFAGMLAETDAQIPAPIGSR